MNKQTINFKASIVFQKNWDAIQQGYRIIINEGSSRSSKTTSIMQLILALCMEKKLAITIVREKMTWIKATILKDFAEVVHAYNLPVTPDINPNRQEQIYNIMGSEIAFFGLDYPEKFKGRKQDIFWMNEAMESNIKVFDQLEMRTTWFGILDYNPSDDEHWIFDRVETRDDALLIHSTFRDNPFLEDAIIKKINSYNPETFDNVRQGTADKYMWMVYGLGKRARLQGLVFPNFEIIKTIPRTATFLAYGLDFGYTNDPAAMCAIYLDGRDLIIDEIFYEKGLNNQEISDKMAECHIDTLDEIFADSSEPKSIDEIFREGFNIKPADKGADSVNFGIDVMKQYRICITENSFNAIKEFKKYKWVEDKNGKLLNKPIDDFNHIIDGARYACIMKLGKDGLEKFRHKQTDGLITANLMDEQF